MTSRVRFVLSVFLFSLAGLVGCGTSPPSSPNQPANTVEFQGLQYQYAIFIPSTYDRVHALPAILLVHGGGGNGPDFLKLWQDFGEKNGIILVAPTLPLGAALEAQVPQLFPLLMDTVKKSWLVDPRRVYVFGYSAGGYSPYDAALLDSTYFAAAGVFACIITPDYYWIVQKAQRKTPLAIYIGDHDRSSPWRRRALSAICFLQTDSQCITSKSQIRTMTALPFPDGLTRTPGIS
jgi:poly(3-hydroxybutyrate) depolymerase